MSSPLRSVEIFNYKGTDIVIQGESTFIGGVEIQTTREYREFVKYKKKQSHPQGITESGCKSLDTLEAMVTPVAPVAK